MPLNIDTSHAFRTYGELVRLVEAIRDAGDDAQETYWLD